MMGNLALYDDVIAEIAARLDLREPNREAVQTINAAVSQYYDVEEQLPPFEAVVDSATGVGKTRLVCKTFAEVARFASRPRRFLGIGTLSDWFEIPRG